MQEDQASGRVPSCMPRSGSLAGARGERAGLAVAPSSHRSRSRAHTWRLQRPRWVPEQRDNSSASTVPARGRHSKLAATASPRPQAPPGDRQHDKEIRSTVLGARDRTIRECRRWPPPPERAAILPLRLRIAHLPAALVSSIAQMTSTCSPAWRTTRSWRRWRRPTGTWTRVSALRGVATRNATERRAVVSP